jgi:hypothetical protein
MERAFYLGSRVFPAAVRQRTDVLLRYCGSNMTSEVWLGRAVVISAFAFLSAAMIFYYTVENMSRALIALFFAITVYHLAAYMLLYFKADSRGRAVEKVLPNLLQLIAANLNSGMTPFQAVKESSRMEFGILKDEIDKTIGLSMGTMPFHDALLDMTTRVRSQMFKNVIELFVEGMRTGGPLANLLNDIARDILENLDLRREIITRSKSYILFIGIIVVFGTPLLSAVSIHFMRTLAGIIEDVSVDVPEIQNVGGITFGQLTLTPEFLTQVAVVNITITALIASWLLAIISEGKNKYMIKYAIFLIPLSLTMFYSLEYLIALVL